MELKVKWLVYMVFATASMLLGGCGDDTTVVSTATAPGIVTGRVVDSSTLQPVKNAEVVLIVNGVKTSTKSSSSDDLDLAGTFVFNGVPPTSNYITSSHILKVTAPGFATTQMYIPVFPATGNTPLTSSVGTIALGKGFDLKVLATDNATPVPGVTINASSPWLNGPAITAVTDADGIATLKGLNQEMTYQVACAPYYDGNGFLKFLSSAVRDIRYNSSGAQVVSLPLVTATSNQDINIVASNLLSDGSADYSYPYSRYQRVITPDSIIKIVFNYPVTISGAITASYVNNLVASNDPAYGKVIAVSTVSASMDATGTILTITNTAPYLKNHSYTFNGTVSAVVNSQLRYFSLANIPSNPYFAGSVYVTDNSSTGLNPLTLLKADNFNGTATTTSDLVWVEFPEKVYGTYRVVAVTREGTTTVMNGGPTSFAFQDGEMVYAANSGGVDDAVVFRLPIHSISLADNSSSSPNDVSVSFHVTDADGNTFSKIVTLPVQ